MTPSFDDDQSLASALFYMSLVTLTDWLRRHRSTASVGAKSMQHRKR